jgi:hypothetical protein
MRNHTRFFKIEMSIFLNRRRPMVKSSVVLILFALLISCSNTAKALIEKNEVDADAKIEKESGEIPDVVLKNFMAKYPNANADKWEKEGDIFNVEFILDGQEYEAEFDNTGRWLETEMEIKIGDLPETIQTVLETKYSGYEIGEAEYVETADYGITYDVVVEKGDKEIEIYFFSDGMILKEETQDADDKEDDESVLGNNPQHFRVLRLTFIL